jgi:NADH-quinone oxidoreductase subunit G
MHRYASKIVRYDIGRAAHWAAGFEAIQSASSADGESEAAGVNVKLLREARNLLIVFGDEQLSSDGARSLAQSLANLLVLTGHAGKADSGLLPLYPHGNMQGVCDAVADGRQQTTDGRRQTTDNRQQTAEDGPIDVAWLVGVGDPVDAPGAAFTVAQELFLTDAARQADVVLPALSAAERDGTYTSGDRRVQRFYRALPALAQAKPDWWIIQEVARRLGAAWSYAGAEPIFAELANQVTEYQGLTYPALKAVAEQWPPMGREDLYYGGTVYDNSGGVGVRYAAGAEKPGFQAAVEWLPAPEPNIEALRRPARLLYQDGELIRRSAVLAAHVVAVDAIAVVEK